MPTMNDVQAPAQRLGVEKFDGRKFAGTKLLAHGELRQEGHAQTAINHTLGCFDRVHFQSHVRDQAGAAEETVSESPVA